MTEQEVIDLMISSNGDIQKWNENCDVVKEAHGGFYPTYWYEKIILSGLAESLGIDTTIRIAPFNKKE